MRYGTHFLQNGQVPGGLDVFGRQQGQPQQVVGEPGPDAPAVGGMPPVQHVAFDELVGGVKQDLLPGFFRPQRQQGRGVLQLIPEAEGSAGLIKSRPAPDAAAEGLIRQPAVHHDVQGGRRGLDLQAGQTLTPEGDRFAPGCFDRRGHLVPNHEFAGPVRIGFLSQQEGHLGRLTGVESQHHLVGEAGFGFGFDAPVKNSVAQGRG